MNRQITSSTTAALEPLNPGDGMTGPLFAINWFNTRWAWLYTLYNLLAARPLSKIGGGVFIKAKLRKTIQGTLNSGRDLLLVVHYPSGDSFLDLLSNRYFQSVSILRFLAVKDFSFVLHKRRDDLEPFDAMRHEFAEGKAYAIHHFRSPDRLEKELQGIASLVADQNISLFFASEKAAEVVIENGRGRRHAMPFETHKLVIFEANCHKILEHALNRSDYRKFSTSLQSSYIGILDRVM